MTAGGQPKDCSRCRGIGPRRCRWGAAASLLPLLLASAPSFAQDAAPPPADPDAPGEEAEPEPDRIDLLEERIAALSERLAQSEEARRKSESRLSWSGYVDFGFFAPIGNRGAGWVQDFGNLQFPAYKNYSWTFLGDILATAVNTRGEVADLGDAPGITRFDSINSDGGAGFLVNEINLRPKYLVSENAVVRASLNFTPRTGENFSLGDFFDADLAEVEYVTPDGKTSFFAGKILPVFGIEYKERKSDQRFAITPSLVARYTTGSQLGLKLRSKLLNDWLIFAAAVTNNSSTIESFHFYSEVDKNFGKTLNGRGALSIPFGRRQDRLEIGLSGEWGPQDRATNNAGKIWFAGVDLQYLGTSFTLKFQAMRGKAPGRPEEGVWGLELRPSGYVEVDWQILAQLGFSLRAEIRDATVTLGSERIYVTKEARYTGGLRVVIGPHIAAKAEYLHNDEYGGIRDFSNDIFTSSLVLAF